MWWKVKWSLVVKLDMKSLPVAYKKRQSSVLFSQCTFTTGGFSLWMWTQILMLWDILTAICVSHSLQYYISDSKASLYVALSNTNSGSSQLITSSLHRRALISLRSTSNQPRQQTLQSPCFYFTCDAWSFILRQWIYWTTRGGLIDFHGVMKDGW